MTNSTFSKISIFAFIILSLTTLGCAYGLRPSCPTNDKAFFYKKAGIRPSKQYMRFHPE